MQLFYNPTIDENTEQLVFDKEESRHIVRVLRKKEGDQLLITNGKNFLFKVAIIIASDKKCTATVIESQAMPAKRSYSLHVAIAPTKNNDRFEWFLEKATEIGIDSITPIICKNSERKIVKIERMNKIIQGAMKQSLQYKLPVLNEATKLADFITTHNNDQLFIAHCEDDKPKQLLRQLVQPEQSYTVLIGPEGDFSTDEIHAAITQGYQPISLGNTRLRTETAGLNAVQRINFIHE